MAASIVALLDFHGTMATIHAHVTQLYALITSPHLESADSLDKFEMLRICFIMPKGGEYSIGKQGGDCGPT